MDKNIVQLHGAIQYFEAIGSWGMAQALRRILASMLMVAAVVLTTACSSIPSFGPGTDYMVFHVNPDDMPRFKADKQRCFEVAAAAHSDDRLVASCLSSIGYRLEVVHTN